jgi:hypothetical protein
MLSSGEIPRGIETAADLLEVSPASQSRKIRSGNAEFSSVCGPYNLAFRRQRAKPVGFGLMHDALSEPVYHILGRCR